jgi:Lanthionine synthetase C-like protein
VGTHRWRAVGEAAWAWVMGQVHWDAGEPWLSETPDAAAAGPDEQFGDGLHSGIAGLALVLAEVKLSRDWTASERELAGGIVRRLERVSTTRREPSLSVGLASDATALRLLASAEVDPVLGRLRNLATAAGWPTTLPRFEGSINDLTLGTAGVVLTGLWAGGELGASVAQVGAQALAAAGQPADPAGRGLSWPVHPELPILHPNYSHGTAGVSAALALAGARLGRTEWVEAAARGAEHLLAIDNHNDQGLRVPHYLPHPAGNDEEEYAYGWCHGPTGTSYLFLALAAAGVPAIGGHEPLDCYRRCLHAVRSSGVPHRLRPGFWDNDGQCCGTAGVGEAFLDAAQLEAGTPDVAQHLAFAQELADALVDRAIQDDQGARWRFLEHRADPPLLPPGTGWMQGAAGIASFLLRSARVSDSGLHAPRVSRPHTLPLEALLKQRSHRSQTVPS